MLNLFAASINISSLTFRHGREAKNINAEAIFRQGEEQKI